MKRFFRKYKKAITSILILVILAALGYWAYLSYQNSGFVKKNNDTNTGNSQTQDGSDLNEKAGSVDAATNGAVDTTKNTDQIPQSTETSIVISQLKQESAGITYEGSITNPGTSGTCTATFTNPYSKPVTQVNKVNGATCGPFTISGTSFDSIGSWTLTLRYYNNNSQAVATGTIEIK